MFHSVVIAGGRNSNLPAPRSLALGLPIEGDHNRAPGISSLLNARFPSAIFLVVWAIIVFSANGIVGSRLSSHVVEEINESVFSPPSVAHEDSSAAISGVVFVVGIVTPIQDVEVGAVFRALSLFLVRPAMPVFRHGLNHLFLVEAATRGRVSAYQMTDADGLFVSAITLTKPVGFIADLMAHANRHQSAEPLARNILSDLSHNAVFEFRSFENGPPEAQLREGFFRGIPLGGSQTGANTDSVVNT